MYKILQLCHRILLTFGINVKRLVNIRYIPLYLLNYLSWKKMGGNVTSFFPILYDYKDHAGVASGQYFHQDLLVAQKIFKKNPDFHVDIGSRIDGFVAHVGSFRKIHVLDIRPLLNSAHDNIVFVQKDLMRDEIDLSSDSVSCLHALEHFGLGRYGDTVNPDGHILGLQAISDIVKPGGTLYLGLPISSSDQVHFNAHRSFHPLSILNWDVIGKNYTLIDLSIIDDQGNLHKSVNVDDAYSYVNKHGCGIYEFRKQH